MRAAALYLVGAVLLVAIVSIAWWTRGFLPPPPAPDAVRTTYTAQAGDTVDSVAASLDVEAQALADANDKSSTTAALAPGETLDVPAPAPSLVDTWKVHGVGLGAQILGVLLSFWLSILTGVLPKTPLRRQVLGISLVLGIASYASAQAVAGDARLTPQFVFGAIKDGFLWSAAFPMFARVLGVKDPTAAPPA